ncbi:MAG: Thiol-disulfide oxidoreductase ResA [Phycisphaerae bacterium]|nr:Thiol-disulfide oxidoreductase ResA [Phycisphaerae bacterium]
MISQMLIVLGLGWLGGLGQTTAPVRPTPLHLGDPAPALELDQWLKGEPLTLAEVKGKIIVLDFWATWCGYCIQAMPHTAELQKKYADQGVIIVGISDEPAGIVREFLTKTEIPLNYRLAVDRAGRTSEAYLAASGQSGIPTAFIVDQQGRVAWIGHPMSMEPILVSMINGTFDLEKTVAEATQAQAAQLADQQFLNSIGIPLMIAMQNKQWDTVVKLAESVADPTNTMSRQLRSDVLGSIAWELATAQKDPQYFAPALDWAKLACELTEQKDPLHLDTYARVLFESGQIEQAITIQTQALALVPEESMTRRELQAALDRYRQPASSPSTQPTSQPAGSSN